MGPFPFDFERQTGGSPREVGAKRIHSLILEFPFIRSPHFEPQARNENSESATKSSLRLKLVRGAQRRKISGVIDDVAIIGDQRASQHEAVAVSAGGSNGCHRWSVLKFINPDGTDALVENSKGRQKTAGCDRQMRIGVVVELQIFESSEELPLIGSRRSVLTGNKSPQISSGFDKPLLSKWNNKDRRNDRLDKSSVALRGRQKAGSAGENRNIGLCAGTA